MHAAKNGHTATAALLLDRGADIGATVPYGKTSLHFAATEGHVATAALLLERGDDARRIGAHKTPRTASHRARSLKLARRQARAALRTAASNGHHDVVAVLAFFGATASTVERRAHPLLAALHGRHKLEIAAAFRLHGLARRALRSGAIAHDPPTAAAAAILATAGSAEPQAPGLPGLPVCAATARLAKAAGRRWSPERHWLYHGGFRAVVHTLMHVQERGWRLDGAAEDAGEEGVADLPYLPAELWFLVCAHLRREDCIRSCPHLLLSAHTGGPSSPDQPFPR